MPCPPQVQLVDLADEIGTEAVVRLLLDELEAAGEVDLWRAATRLWLVHSSPACSRQPGRNDARVDQSSAYAGAACRRIDQQDAQLRRGVVGTDAEDASDPCTRGLGDPCRFELVSGRSRSRRRSGTPALRRTCPIRTLRRRAHRAPSPPIRGRRVDPTGERRRCLHLGTRRSL